MPDLFSGANSTGLNVININSELQHFSCDLMAKYAMECKLILSEIPPDFQLESVKLPTIVPAEKNGIVLPRFVVTKRVKILKKNCRKCVRLLGK